MNLLNYGKRVYSVISSGVPSDMITHDLIRDIYGVEVLVRHDAEAGLHLIPIGVGL
ncbi:hypothetical protein [Paenibacillus sp. CFBP13512]|uniref:hypothetical protein n=1 Tax=Paenibacillus sp. CFBP13512 TaxID=2184007 RepID=UPI001375C30B|nr:hypothetical protein [Paenibacillus sp. CFBP13512]